MPRAEFLAQFPVGQYILLGITVENQWMLSEAKVTKEIPKGSTLISPEENAIVDPDTDLVVEWELVDDPNPPESVIEFYEVVVEKDEADEIRRVLSIIMNSDETTITIPAVFLEPGRDYKVEIISEETSGNRASIEVPISTSGDDE